MFLLIAAPLARRTTPGPKSIRYAVSFTTIAVAGPDLSGVAAGVPVPSRTTFVWSDCAGVEACDAVSDAVTNAMAQNPAPNTATWTAERRMAGVYTCTGNS
jgi:hypothetical protein